jgi:hypothetical protein
MNELELLQRRLGRERRARKETEALLEQKRLELDQANQELRQLTETLRESVAGLAEARDQALRANRAGVSANRLYGFGHIMALGRMALR